MSTSLAQGPLTTAEATLIADTDRVEMVASRVQPGHYRMAAASGSCEFRRSEAGYEVLEVVGRDPLADQATDRFLGLSTERAATSPSTANNAYPYAFERVAQIFDHPSPPDLVVIRTAAFHVHGNLGEHGSLDAVQSRGAFVAGGAGIRNDGVIDRHLQAVDFAPTVAAVLGCKPDERGFHLAVQDGRVDEDLLTGDVAGHVIAFLFDGLNANLLCDALAAGDAPVIAGLLDIGTCYTEGLVATLPSVTLPNHTTLITGVHPGHHGILSNEWLDRRTGQAHNLLDLPQMMKACDQLLPGVETIFEAVTRSHPDAFCAATYEYADRGADWSTYAEVRAERRPEGIPRRGETIADATTHWVETNPRYRFISRIDTASAAQACMLLDPSAETPPPRFLWVNFSLTDEAGHHSGPHGEEARDAIRDTDTRMGHVVEAAKRAGTFDDTALFMLADHGMELTDPEVDGHYHPALDAAGVSYRDLGDGLIYLD